MQKTNTSRRVGPYDIHEVTPGLDAWCSPLGMMINVSGGSGLTANLGAMLQINDRDTALRLASILIEAAELMRVTPEPVAADPIGDALASVPVSVAAFDGTLADSASESQGRGEQ